MIIPETPPASGAPRNAHAQSSHKRTIVEGRDALPGHCLRPRRRAYCNRCTSVHEQPYDIPFGSLAPPPCSGGKPGICPDSPFASRIKQAAVHPDWACFS